MAELKQSEQEEAALAAGAGSRRPIAEELRQLIAAIQEFVATELAYQALRAKLMGRSAAVIAGSGALALALFFFSLMALVMGLLLALAPWLGRWGAMGAVVGGLLIATAIAGGIAWAALRKFIGLLHDGKDS